MDKFLIFIDGTDDAAMYPLSRLLGVTVAAEGVVNLRFEPSFNGGPADGDVDTVALTCAADSEKTVFQSIVAAINANPNGDPAVVIADDVNSVYVDSNITACTITLGA